MPIKEALLPMLGPTQIPPRYPDGSPGPGDRRGGAESTRSWSEAPARRVVEIVDRSQWNQLLVARSDYDLAQGWEWSEIQRDAGWTPHRYAVLAGEECLAAVSVAHRQLPGLPYSILYACHGPLMDWSDERPWRELLRPIQRLAHRHHVIFMRVSPNASHDDVAASDALARHGFRPLAEDWTTWNAPRAVLTLSLEGDEDAQLRRLRKGTRRDLAAAQRRGAQVRVARDQADLLAFHRLTAAAGREKGYPVRPLARLQAMWDTYVARGDGVLLLTEHEGTLVGGLLGLRLGRRAYLQRSAVVRSGEGQRVHQGPLLYWEFIRWARSAGCDLIDWGGSGTRFPPVEGDEGWGLYQFKTGFGSVLNYRLPYHDLVFRPGLYQFARAAERWALPMAWQLRARLNR